MRLGTIIGSSAVLGATAEEADWGYAGEAGAEAPVGGLRDLYPVLRQEYSGS
jgi:hypothetical protein